MANPTDFIVWEWYDEYQRWRPYSVVVSNHIQKQYESLQTKSGAVTVTKLDLGQVDSRLRAYEVDLTSSFQVNISTGE